MLLNVNVIAAHASGDADDEPVAAPRRPKAAAPGQVDRGPDDEQVDRPEGEEPVVRESPDPSAPGEINACTLSTSPQ